MLVRKGAHLNEKNKDFLTALHVAADLGHYAVLETLLQHGAKVNAVDGLGQTGIVKFLYKRLTPCLPSTSFIERISMGKVIRGNRFCTCEGFFIFYCLVFCFVFWWRGGHK